MEKANLPRWPSRKHPKSHPFRIRPRQSLQAAQQRELPLFDGFFSADKNESRTFEIFDAPPADVYAKVRKAKDLTPITRQSPCAAAMKPASRKSCKSR